MPDDDRLAVLERRVDGLERRLGELKQEMGDVKRVHERDMAAIRTTWLLSGARRNGNNDKHESVAEYWTAWLITAAIIIAIGVSPLDEWVGSWLVEFLSFASSP